MCSCVSSLASTNSVIFFDRVYVMVNEIFHCTGGKWSWSFVDFPCIHSYGVFTLRFGFEELYVVHDFKIVEAVKILGINRANLWCRKDNGQCF